MNGKENLPWICSGCTKDQATCGKTESECLIILQRQVDSERFTRTTKYRETVRFK